MRNEYIAYPKRVSVYAQGKRAFEEHKDRGYNPYAASNLAFAISWWHGWDTAEEESKDDVTQPRQGDTLARMHVHHLSKKKRNENEMPEIINPMEKQVVYAEGKKAFVDGKHRGDNQYRARNKELASIWRDGWDQAKKDSERAKSKDRRLKNIL